MEFWGERRSELKELVGIGGRGCGLATATAGQEEARREHENVRADIQRK